VNDGAGTIFDELEAWVLFILSVIFSGYGILMNINVCSINRYRENT
jgi:hypothetical protein